MYELSGSNEHLARALELLDDKYCEYMKNGEYDKAEILTKTKNQIISAIKNINKLF